MISTWAASSSCSWRSLSCMSVLAVPRCRWAPRGVRDPLGVVPTLLFLGVTSGPSLSSVTAYRLRPRAAFLLLGVLVVVVVEVKHRPQVLTNTSSCSELYHLYCDTLSFLKTNIYVSVFAAVTKYFMIRLFFEILRVMNKERYMNFQIILH